MNGYSWLNVNLDAITCMRGGERSYSERGKPHAGYQDFNLFVDPKGFANVTKMSDAQEINCRAGTRNLKKYGFIEYQETTWARDAFMDGSSRRRQTMNSDN